MPGPGTLQAGQFAGTLTTALGTATVTENPYDLTHPPLSNEQFLLSGVELLAGFDTPTLTGIQFLDTAAVIDTGGTTTRTLSTKPALVDGCTVVLFSSGNNNPLQTVTPPSGFTSVRRVDNASNIHVDVFVKYVASAATEAGVAWTITSSGTDKGVHRFMVFTGVDQTTPFNVENGAAETGAGTSPWTHSTPSITTTVANTVLLWVTLDRQTTVGAYSTASPDYQWDYNPDNTGGTNAIAGRTAITDQVTTGTYSRSVTVTGGGTYNNAVMWIGALNPAPSGTAFTDTETDNAGLADDVAPVVAFGRTQDDPAGVTDAVSTALAYARTQDDTSGLIDAVTAASAFVRQQDDDAGLTDSVSSFVAKLAQVDDPAGLVDSIATAIGYARTQTDTAGITDAIATAIAWARSQTDVTGITDSVVSAVGRLVQQDDVTGLTDVASAALGINRTQSDDAGITDSASTAAAFSRTNTDVVGITDSVTFTNGALAVDYTATFDDDSGLLDSVSSVLSRGLFQFTPPTKLRAARQLGKLMGRVSIPVGISVLRTGLIVTQIEDPDTDQIDAADAVYLGGRTYTVDATEASILTAAGYGAYLS